MNTDNLTEKTETPKPSTEIDTDFTSIDDPNLKWPTFFLSMLRLGRILTTKTQVRRELRSAGVSRLMKRHKNEVGRTYSAKEIREDFKYHGCYLVGGGITVEGNEMPIRGRDNTDYEFTFTKLYTAEEWAAILGGVKHES